MIIDILKSILSFIKSLFTSSKTTSKEEFKLEAEKESVETKIKEIEKREAALEKDGVEKFTKEETVEYWKNQ